MGFSGESALVYQRAIKTMFSQRPINEEMRELIKFASQQIVHPIWDKYLAFDFNQEVDSLRNRIHDELQTHSTSAAILFFCLADMGDEMSLIFLKKECEPKDDGDWGAYNHRVWSDIPSAMLTSMYMVAEADLPDGVGGYTNSDVRWIIETCFPLAYAGLCVGHALRSLSPSTLLGSDSHRRVAVFFGEGEEVFLGRIDSEGFRYDPIPYQS